jgi:GT2 family glycosyltransferase
MPNGACYIRQVEKIETSLIILNWNGRAFLEPCLVSLFGQTYRNFEIVLVDNGSSDGSLEMVQEKFGSYRHNDALPYLKIVALGENRGFAGGNLAGFAQANPHARFIATLNNDTVAEPGWLEILSYRLRALPQAEKWGAVCGCLLFDSNRTVNSAGIEVYRNGLALDRAIGQSAEFANLSQEVFGVSAGAAVYRREAIEDSGGFFDEDFFAYLEDADLAWRMRLRGWRSLFVAQEGAVVRHAHSGTGKQGSPFKSFQLGRNRWWVILKNMPAKLLLKNLPAILFYDFGAMAYALAKNDFASLKGRLTALHPKYWAELWNKRRLTQKYRLVNDSDAAKWLQPSPSPLASLKLRKSVDIAAKRN